MNLIRFALVAGVIHLASLQHAVPGEADKDWPAFNEVYGLLRSNLINLSESALNRAAVRGLLKELDPMALCITNVPASTPGETRPLIAKAAVLDDSFAYIRPDRIETGLAEDLTSHYVKLKTPKGLKGMILDLRFVCGRDYAAAAALADRYFKTEQPLLDWGSGSARSTPKSTSWDMPLMILVNRKTASAAEALAAVLQKAKIGLVLGSRTAGQALVFKDFPLTTDFLLRVAVANIKVGGDLALTSNGVTPDITVNVPEADEKAYLDNPYQAQSKVDSETTGPSRMDTNRLVGRRVNEADLVRRQREGLDADRDLVPGGTREGSEKQPIVRDPVLARALDLLKGIAVVYQSRQP
jgi:hypothetical protein